MKISVEVDEDELQKAIIDILAKESVKTYFKRYEYKGVEKAVKEVVYGQKEILVSRCVDKASAELTRKALPKLLEKLSE